jgi:holo-[acyl-carrier protein] synthase
MSAIGVDTVHLPSFREQLADASSGFLQGTFTAAEIALANTRPSGDPVRHLAVRFAAKEAFLKAWDSAFWGRRAPLEAVDLKEIEVVSDLWGRPALVFHGRVAAALGEADAMVSLSHDGPNAMAVVLLSFNRAGAESERADPSPLSADPREPAR